MSWVKRGAQGPQRLHAFSTSVATIPTAVAPVEAHLDPGYDVEGDGLLVGVNAAIAAAVVFGTIADIVALHIARLRRPR